MRTEIIKGRGGINIIHRLKTSRKRWLFHNIESAWAINFTTYDHTKHQLYLGNGRPDCHGTKGTGVDRMPRCETLQKWVDWMLRCLGYLWPWIFKVKLYLGNGRPDCHGKKGTGVGRMTCCETLRKWVKRMLRWLGYFDLYIWPWIFKVKLYLGNGRPDYRGMKGTGDNSMHALM